MQYRTAGKPLPPGRDRKEPIALVAMAGRPWPAVVVLHVTGLVATGHNVLAQVQPAAATSPALQDVVGVQALALLSRPTAQLARRQQGELGKQSLIGFGH